MADALFSLIKQLILHAAQLHISKQFYFSGGVLLLLWVLWPPTSPAAATLPIRPGPSAALSLYQ